MIRHAPLALAAALTLGSAMPAAAACADDVAALEERLAQLPPEGQEEEQVELNTTGGEVTVGAEQSEEPTDSWFGPVPSVEGARLQLDNARELAEDGDEAGCQGHVDQAREIVEGLEG